MRLLNIGLILAVCSGLSFSTQNAFADAASEAKERADRAESEAREARADRDKAKAEKETRDIKNGDSCKPSSSEKGTAKGK